MATLVVALTLLASVTIVTLPNPFSTQWEILMIGLSFAPPVPPAQALSKFNICRTFDIQEAVLCGERMFCRNRLEQKGPNFMANFFHRSVDSMSIARMSFGGEVTIEPGRLDDFVLVQALIQGRENVMSGAHFLTCTPKHATVFNYHQQATLNHFPGTDKLVVRLDRMLLEAALQKQLESGIKQDIMFQPHLSFESEVGQSWLQTLAWACTLLSNTPTLSAHLSGLISQSLATALLNFQDSNYSQTLHEVAEKQIIPAVVRKVEDYVEQHAQEAISLTELATHAGVSARAVQLSFQRFRGISPLQYLKEVRLRGARKDLNSGNAQNSHVSTVAMKWGFSHLGRFAAEYMRRFGELPSATLKRQID